MSRRAPTRLDQIRTPLFRSRAGRSCENAASWAKTGCPRMITRHSVIDLVFVIAPHSLLLDVAGPAEAFRLANLHRAARKLSPPFRLRFPGPVAPVPSSSALAIADLEPLPQLSSTPTWVVLAGQPSAHLGKVTSAIATTAQWLGSTFHKHLYPARPP